MLKRKVLDPADLAVPPTQAEIVPYLWKGAVLAFRMVVTFGEQGCCCPAAAVLLLTLNSYAREDMGHKGLVGDLGSGCVHAMVPPASLG